MNSVSSFDAICSFTRRRLLAVVFAACVPAAYGQPAWIQLPEAAHGSAAITALGAHLPAVARAYGMEANHLVTLLQTQPSMGVDKNAALLFACEGLAVRADGSLVHGRGERGNNAGTTGEAMTPNSSVTMLANGSAVDAFKLHSLPGVTRFILLDFNGHTTSGTSWNSSYNGGNAIVSAPFDLDGDPSTFSEGERGMIQRIWQRVAEDYAPFGVDVTTEDPGVESLRKTATNDSAFGVRVVISPSNWYNSGAGGVAYIGSFSWNTDTPCFAFSQQLANGEKYIAEAVSHEIGHTLSLYHDGASGTEYYTGHGSWAPIMGVGYYQTVVQFSKGEYSTANNTQDDVVVVTSHIPLAADDHGNTNAGATLISGPAVATGGTIETRTDVDVLRFDSGAGAMTFSIRGPAPDSNLNLKVDLVNAAGQLVQASDSADLTASIAATVTAGTYYLWISGVGDGGTASTGYTDYASIGNYIITGSFPTAGVQQAPVAVATPSATSGVAPLTVTFSGANSTDSDGTIASYAWNFGNSSTGSGISSSTTYANPGIYSAVLTVIDSDGLAGTATVAINVTAAANQPPIASATASATGSTAPVAVNFNGSGSSDPDGAIVSHHWDFGDGTTGSGAAPAKVYSVPGNYTARLTVTDDRGATAAATASVTVARNPEFDAGVKTFTLIAVSAKAGNTAQAAVVIVDRNGRPVSGASVTLAWSGVVSGNSTGTTNSTGQVVLTSPKSKKTGTVSANITRVTVPAAYWYDPSLSTSLQQTVTLR